LVHARSERADVVAWVRELPAVAPGQGYAQAAAIAGRRCDEAVIQLVARFNGHGLAALEPHGIPKNRIPIQPVKRSKIRS
jgi:hypothetical protein